MPDNRSRPQAAQPPTAQPRTAQSRAGRPHTGRRRNEAARQAVLDAAAALLGRPDGASTSVEEISQASGVSKHTIYRWWPSKGAVLLEAMVEQARQEAGSPRGEAGEVEKFEEAETARKAVQTENAREAAENLVPGLEQFLAATFRAAERAAPLLRGAMAEAQRDPRAADGMRQFAAARRDELRGVLRAARERGELSSAADLDLITEQVYGFLWYRILLGHAPLTPADATRLTRSLTSG